MKTKIYCFKWVAWEIVSQGVRDQGENFSKAAWYARFAGEHLPFHFYPVTQGDITLHCKRIMHHLIL